MRSSGRSVLSSGSPDMSTNGYQTLFMPMSAAAVRAARACVASIRPSSSRALTSAGARAASAAASAAPTACAGVRLDRLMTASRLSRRSLAYSGMRSLMAWSCMASFLYEGVSPASKRRASDRPVARAELVGLKAVENAQHLFRIPADVQVVDRHVLDHVVRVDDEGRAQRHAFLGAHAELIDERAGDVRELPLVEALEIGMVAPPAELRELVVGRAAENDRVAILEVLRELGEADDLRRTHEGEVLGVEVDDLPLAGKRFFVDRLKGRLAVFFMPVEAGLDPDDMERFQFLAYGFHGRSFKRGSARTAPASRNENDSYIMDTIIVIQFVYIDRPLNVCL